MIRRPAVRRQPHRDHRTRLLDMSGIPSRSAGFLRGANTMATSR
jgi:hypothetical protein